MKAMTRACLTALAVLFTLGTNAARAQAAETADPALERAAAPAIIRVVAPADRTTEPLVSMSFDETPLADVIKAFREATGANIISSGTNLQETVSVRLDNVPWKKGLGSILDQRGLQLVEQPPESGIFIVSAKLAAETPKVTRTFSLIHCRADEVAKLFATTLGSTGIATPFPSANVVIVTATGQQIQECEDIIVAIDKPRLQVYIEARFVELAAGTSKKLGLQWDSLSSWGATLNNMKAGGEVNYGELIKLETAGSTVRDGATPVPGSMAPNADGVYNPVYQKERVTTFLAPDKILDAPNAGRSASDMMWRKAAGIGGILSIDDFRLAMSAFESIGGASVFSNPKVIVANEETARVDMTTKEPNVEVNFQAATSQNGSDSITTKLGVIPGRDEPFVGEAFFSYGISLKVTPRVSTSGLITVEIEPSISDFVKYFELQGINPNQPAAKFPVIEYRRIKTIFTMDDGKTAVIGGLTRTLENSTDSGIPWLRNLPWIGPRLFGWKSRQKDQREIIIFVTVGIADPVEMREDVGLPKNALIGRDFVTGSRREPGDRTLEDLMTLDDMPIRPALLRDGAVEAGNEAAAAAGNP